MLINYYLKKRHVLVNKVKIPCFTLHMEYDKELKNKEI